MNLTIRYSDPTVVSSQKGGKMLDLVIPHILNKGLNASAEDVKKFNLATLLQLCQKSGPFLKSYAADIVGTLIEAMTSMEPQAINYLSFHAEKYDISQEVVSYRLTYHFIYINSKFPQKSIAHGLARKFKSQCNEDVPNYGSSRKVY
jgi:hypothetical protein